jgi:hypothetical protein
MQADSEGEIAVVIWKEKSCLSRRPMKPEWFDGIDENLKLKGEGKRRSFGRRREIMYGILLSPPLDTAEFQKPPYIY